MADNNDIGQNLNIPTPDLGLDSNLDLGPSVTSTQATSTQAPKPPEKKTEPAPAPIPITTSDSKVLDRVIIGICLFIFAVSTYLITDERLLFSLGSDHKNLEVIAQVSRGGKDIRRRLEQDPVWYGVSAPDLLYQADSIFNGEKIDMEVVFKDGQKIQINPGSLVVLRKTADGQNKLKVETGTITASNEGGSGKGLVLESQGKVIKLSGDNAKAVFSVKRGEGASVAVMGGQATLTADGKVQTLQKDQVARADASGKILDIQTMPIQLKSPAMGSLIWAKSDKAVGFAWTPFKDAEYYTFQLAADYDFTRILYSKRTNAEQLAVSGLGGNKSFFWRVTAQPKKAKEVGSQIAQFTLKVESGPRLLLPPYDRVLKVVQKIERGIASTKPMPLLNVLLQWQDETGAKVFKVQVAQNENFEPVVFENVTPGTSIETPKLPAGKYYWRVKIQDASRPDAVWSKLSQFTVGESGLEGAPQLRLPKNLDQVVINKTKNRVRFVWDKREGSNAYELQVSNSPDFANLVVSQNIKSLNQDWEDPKLGTYYWRVRGITSDGTATEFSQPARFDVVNKKKLAPPQIIKPKVKFETTFLEILFHLFVSTAEASDGPSLEWQRVEGAVKYRVEISPTRGFEKIIYREDVTSVTHTWPNPQPGGFFWRVSAIGEDGEVGQASEPGEINITTGPPTPVTSGVVAGKTTPEKAAEPKVDVDFKWTQSRHAKSYEVQISEEPSFDGAVSKKVVKNLEKIELPKSGKYFWRVRSLDQSGAPLSRFSEIKEVDIKKVVGNEPLPQAPVAAATPAPKLPTPPSLNLNRSNNPKIGGVQWTMPTDKIWHDRESVNFGWTANQYVKLYHLKVFKLDPLKPKTNSTLQFETSTRRLGHYMDHLDPGGYYALLETLKTDGGQGPSPNPFFFTVRRAKPVEFGHIDLKLSYGANNSTVTSSIVENNISVTGSALGGTTQIEANTTFNDSSYGLKAVLNYNAIKYADTNLVSNDFIFAATARYDDLWSDGMLRPYVGGRAWNTPIVLQDQLYSSQPYFQYFQPLLVGPVIGLEAKHKIGMFTIHGMAEASLPLTNTNIGTFNPSIRAEPVLNSKFEIGTHLTPPLWDNFSIFALAGMSSDKLEWRPTNTNPLGSGNSSTKIDNTYVRLGVELLTDSSNYYAPKAKSKPSLFSDFDFALGYSLKTLNYSLQTNRTVTANPQIVDRPGTYATALFAEAEGWFSLEELGVRMNGQWTQFPERGTSLGFAETTVQLGLRPIVTRNSGFEFKNFLGLRHWNIPYVDFSNGNGTSFIRHPGFMGPVDTLKVGYRFHPRFVIYALGEVSYPLLLTNADTNMGTVNSQFMSYRYEGSMIIGLTPDLHIGASYGMKTDQLHYYTRDSVEPSASRIDIQSPVTSVFFMYSL